LPVLLTIKGALFWRMKAVKGYVLDLAEYWHVRRRGLKFLLLSSPD
jgi:hypothetical protein